MNNNISSSNNSNNNYNNNNNTKIKYNKSLYKLIIFFILGIIILIICILNFPYMDNNQKSLILQIPNTPQKLKLFVKGIKSYSDTNFVLILNMFVWLYLL